MPTIDQIHIAISLNKQDISAAVRELAKDAGIDTTTMRDHVVRELGYVDKRGGRRL
jgi:hypothetical protein